MPHLMTYQNYKNSIYRSQSLKIMYNIHIRESKGRLHGFTIVQKVGVWLDIHPLLDSFAVDVRIRSILQMLSVVASIKQGRGHICIDKLTRASFLTGRRYVTVGNRSSTSKDVSRTFDCLFILFYFY